MRLTFDAKQLASAVTWTARYANPRHQVPILSGLLFQPADEGDWTVTGFDYDHCATAMLEPETAAGPFDRFVLHGRWLATLVSKLTGNVTLDIDNGVATITSGRGRWQLPCMAAGEYPKLPEDPASIGTVPAGELRAALARVAFAVSRSDAVPGLTMACLSSADGHLEIVATDKYRISRTFLPWLHKDQDPFLIDPEAFSQMLPDTREEAALLFDPDTLMTGVACGDRVLVSRGMDERFPAVGPFFDRPPTVLCTTNRDALLGALEQATLTADPLTPVVLEWNTEDGSLGLEAKDQQLSSAGSVEIDAHATEDGWSAIKLQYLRDALKIGDSEYVTLGFAGANGAAKAVQLASSEDEDAVEWVPDTTHQQMIQALRFDR
jgi:DNA polymerase-3 subunit beta